MPLTGYLTINEAAERLNVSRITIYRWRKEGVMKAEVPPGSTRQAIPVSEVRRIRRERGDN